MQWRISHRYSERSPKLIMATQCFAKFITHGASYVSLESNGMGRDLRSTVLIGITLVQLPPVFKLEKYFVSVCSVQDWTTHCAPAARIFSLRFFASSPTQLICLDGVRAHVLWQPNTHAQPRTYDWSEKQRRTAQDRQAGTHAHTIKDTCVLPDFRLSVSAMLGTRIYRPKRIQCQLTIE